MFYTKFLHSKESNNIFKPKPLNQKKNTLKISQNIEHSKYIQILLVSQYKFLCEITKIKKNFTKKIFLLFTHLTFLNMGKRELNKKTRLCI